MFDCCKSREDERFFWEIEVHDDEDEEVTMLEVDENTEERLEFLSSGSDNSFNDSTFFIEFLTFSFFDDRLLLDRYEFCLELSLPLFFVCQ